MKRIAIVLALLLAGCTQLVEPGECQWAQKPNPYGYPGQPITVCVCPDGATYPEVCK